MMLIKDWKISQLDSGHWIAELAGLGQSPVHHNQGWIKQWIRAYVKKYNRGIDK